jgi:hypothetical protein
MDIQLLTVVIPQDAKNGGYTNFLLAREQNFVKKKSFQMGRYWDQAHTQGSLHAIALAMAQLQSNAKALTILNNPYCSIGSFRFWDHMREEPPSETKIPMIKLIQHLRNIEIKNRQINMTDELERSLYYKAKKAADTCSQLTQILDSHLICPKCFTDYDPDTARMFGWECHNCTKEALIEI